MESKKDPMTKWPTQNNRKQTITLVLYVYNEQRKKYYNF